MYGTFRFILALPLTLALIACDSSEQTTETTATEAAPAASSDNNQPEASQAASSTPEYDAAAFFQTTTYFMSSASGHAFATTGDALLVNSDETGVFNVYAMDPVTGEADALTDSTTNAVFAVSYFPRDNRVLYTFDEGGNELNHLYVRTPEKETQDLTPGENVKASFSGWHQDNSVFWVTTNERDAKFFDLYQYNAGDYERTLIFQNDDGYSIDDVSPNGQWLALTKSRTSADSDLYLVNLAGDDQTPKLITEHDGNISYGVYDFTADNQALIYATNEHGEFNQAWSYNLANGEKSAVLEADWDVQFYLDSPSGRYRVSGINADASTELTLYDNEAKAPVTLPELPAGDISQVRFSGNEAKIAFVINSDTSPSNVHVVSLADQQHNQLTQALNPDIDEANLVNSSVVRYPSFDGLAIPGVLYKPKGASAENPVPALVWVHGGPGGQSRQGYSAAQQHLVNHGYALLAANNRGSSGYGKTFFHMDDKKHGEVDLQDIVYAKQYLAGLDWVDADSIAIIGGSYGGYMVAAALAFEPDVFDAGIDIFGVTNWVRTLDSIPPWWESFKESLYDEMGDPAVDAERHRRISPLFHASQITKPLLVVQGANDPRVLQIESDELVQAVRANNVPVEYIVFPDEGHGFRKRENRITASAAYVEFLDKHLGKDSE